MKDRTHNVETSGLRNRCSVQLNAIGVAKPPSLFVETHGTEQGSPADEITNVLNEEGDRNPAPLVVYPTLRAPRISAGTHLGHSTIRSSATCIRRQMARSSGEERHEQTVLGAAVARDCRRHAAPAVSRAA